MTIFFLVVGLVVLLGLIFFLPYDWWQKPPARQSDRLIGKLLPSLNISIRNIVLRAISLVVSVLVYLYSIIWIPIFAGVLICGALLQAIYSMIFKRGEARQPVSGLIILLLTGSIFAVGIIAPLRLAPIAGYLALGRPAGNSWEVLTVGKGWTTMDGIIGLCGIFGVASWLLVDATWRFRQVRQVENLATSKVGALAIGLVEVSGTVRPLAGAGREPAVELSYGMFNYLVPSQRIERFLLEDKTGSVLVDATECRVRAGWVSEVAAIFGVREIVLGRRKVRDEFSDAIRLTLQYGDSVYVIGNAERDESGSLVIKPATRPGWNEVLWKTLFGAIRPPRGKDIHDVFFITDGDQQSAKRHIMRGFRRVLFWALVWITSSVTVMWTAQQPWRQAPPPDSWRSAYWRGPEPGSGDGIDYSRDMRLFRFEKYVKGLTPQSLDALSAIIEAIGYENTRFREPAIQALMMMFAAAGPQAEEAIPHLIKSLGDRRAQVIQLSIIALSRFGPRAAPAVPALIEQLKCQKTNTYEVSPNIIRFQAARALGRIGPAAKDAIPALKEALSDPSPAVRDAARYALKQIE